MEANHEILSTLTSYSLINSETIQSYSLLFKDEFITQEANKHFEQFDSYSKQTKKLLLQLKSKHHKNGLLFGFDNDLLSAVGFLNQKTDLKLPEEDIEGEKEEKEEKQKEKEKQKQKEKQKEKEKEKEQKAEIVFKTFCLSTKLFDIKNPLKYSTLFHRSHFLPKLPLIEKYFESIKEIQQGKNKRQRKRKNTFTLKPEEIWIKKGSKNNKILKFKNHPIINTKDNSYNLQFQFFLAFFSNQSENSDNKTNFDLLLQHLRSLTVLSLRKEPQNILSSFLEYILKIVKEEKMKLDNSLVYEKFLKILFWLYYTTGQFQILLLLIKNLINTKYNKTILTENIQKGINEIFNFIPLKEFKISNILGKINEFKEISFNIKNYHYDYNTRHNANDDNMNLVEDFNKDNIFLKFQPSLAISEHFLYVYCSYGLLKVGKGQLNSKIGKVYQILTLNKLWQEKLNNIKNRNCSICILENYLFFWNGQNLIKINKKDLSIIKKYELNEINFLFNLPIFINQNNKIKKKLKNKLNLLNLFKKKNI